MLQKRPLPTVLFTAPVIVEGTITGVDILQRALNSKVIPEARLDYLQVAIGHCRYLSGAPTGSRLRFLTYCYSAENVRTLGAPAFSPRVGQHRIFFLMKEGEALRNRLDVLESTLRVRSGRHDAIDPAWDHSPEERLAWILLTPGEGCEVEEFSLDLQENLYLALAATSERSTIQLLRPLLTSSEERICEAAGEQAKAWRWTVGP